MQKLLGSLAILLVAPAVIGQCVSAGAGATSYGAGDDFVANSGVGIDMGFGFPVGDGMGGQVTYQFIHPSSNGFCYLSDGTPTYTNSDLSPSEADMFTNEPRVAVCWDDMNLVAGNNADLLVDTSVAGQCTVTWVNIVPFGETTTFNMQCVLYASGEIDFNYDTPAFNDTDAIVGVSPGNSAAGTQPTSIDLTGGVPSTNDMTHELFAGFALDLGASSCKLVPTLPGYVPVIQNAGCADSYTYGDGCIDVPDASYEFFPAGTIDICQSGTTITFINSGTDYTILDQIPGTFMPAQGNEVVWSTLDDGFAQIPLSGAMPTINGGTTMTLTACTNGFVALDANQPTFTGNLWTPSLDKFNEFDVPTILGPWYDWNPSATGAGRVIYEEIAGIMYITWEDVTPFNGGGITDKWQFQFEVATGNVTIVYDTMNYSGASTWHTPMFGFTVGNASNSKEIDFSAELTSGLVASFTPILPLRLSVNNPVLGVGWDLTTSNIDAVSPISVTFFGDGTPGVGLPLPVIGINSPGCGIWLSTVLANASALNAGGTSLVTVPLPNNMALAGAELTAQSICLTVDLPGNIKTSNGAHGTLGL